MAYLGHLTRYQDTLFSEEKIRRQIIGAADFLRPHLAETGPRALARFESFVAPFPSARKAMALMSFVMKRRESVQRQLAGGSSGEKLRWGAPPGPRAVGLAVVVVSVALAMNLGACIWSAIAGFKGSAAWGVLNLVFYPLSPMIYGFWLRRDLGRRSGLAALVSINVLGVAIWIAFLALRPS